MSLFKLDDRREQLDQRTENTQTQVDQAERSTQGDTAMLLIAVGVFALGVGWWTSDPRDTFRFAAALGAVLATFILGGIVGGITAKISGKWRLAFLITAVIFLGMQSLVKVFEDRLVDAPNTNTNTNTNKPYRPPNQRS